MSMRVATNVSAINAQRSLSTNDRGINSSYEKLSSGSRINKAADDAAGLAISEGLKAQIRFFTPSPKKCQRWYLARANC